MSNSKTCRTVWLAMTGLPIANLTGWDSASAVSIMLGGAACSTHRCVATPTRCASNA